jgi:PAS domain-containing protein
VIILKNKVKPRLLDIWNFLIATNDRLETIEDKYKSKSIALTLIIAIPLSYIINFMYVYISYSPKNIWSHPLVIYMSIAEIGLIFAYIINRKGYMYGGSLLVLITATLSVIISSLYSTNGNIDIAFLYYLLSAIIFCGVIFSRNSMLLIITIICGLVALIPIIIPKISFLSVMPVLFYLPFLSILIYLYTLNRNQLLILKQNELESSEKKFKNLVEVTIEGIVLHENGIILDTNNQFARMFGY